MTADDFKAGLVALIPRLRAYAMSLTRTPALADDLVQDTLERAWRARDGFRPDSDLRIWLFTILRNRFTDGYRRQKHTVQDVDGQHAIRVSSPAEQHWQLQYDDLLQAMARLPPDSRSALILISGAGLTFEEAARVCGCPISTIKSRVQRARRSLLQIVDIAPPRKPRRSPKPGDGHHDAGQSLENPG